MKSGEFARKRGKYHFMFLSTQRPKWFQKISKMATVRKLEKQSLTYYARINYWKEGFGVGTVLKSRDLLAGGHRWSVLFYPMGINAAVHREGYASLFIALHTQTPQPVEFLWSLAIINQIDHPDSDYRISSLYGSLHFRQVAFLSGGSMIGMPRFIARSLLEFNNGYVRDDLIKIQLIIGVLTCRPRVCRSELDDLIYFRVADQTFCAQRSVVALPWCSGFLQRGAYHTVVITDVEPQIFKVVLWYIYSKSLEERDKRAITNSNGFTPGSFAAKLLAAANKFGLKKLAKMCQCIVSGERIPNQKSMLESIFDHFEHSLGDPFPDKHGDHDMNIRIQVLPRILVQPNNT